ncbi:MAG: hypothetical protein WCA22_06235 [Candidatus Binatus sp.]
MISLKSSSLNWEEDRFAIFKAGTGFADAKLSEILPAARVARFVRMTQKKRCEETRRPNFVPDSAVGFGAEVVMR